MTILQFANNATTTLAQPITAISTTIYLAAGTGDLFPQPTTGFNFLATIYNTSSTLDEVVLVIARNGDQLTVNRAQEGTVSQTWIVGDTIGMYPTKGTMEKMVQNDQFQNGKYAVAQAAGTANALTCTINSDLTTIPDGMSIIVKPIYANTGNTTLQINLGSTFIPAKKILKGLNLELSPNDIPAAGYPVALIYSAIFDAWFMQMPATLINPPTPPTYQANFAIVAGGGGGGYINSTPGGGGAGGYVASSATLTVGVTYTMIVGGGGATYTQGVDSGIIGIAYATGGGRGASGASAADRGVGGNGGSGGGGGAASGTDVPPPYSGGAGISGQGNNGGQGTTFAAGGGGGAGAVGGNGSGDVGGNGGVGALNTLTGSPIYLAGGGGGFGGAGGGAGGLGGGGSQGNPGQYGTGGGGGCFSTGTGGGGTIIFTVPTSRYSGITTGAPIITTSGATTVMKFNTSGTYTA